ncbi:MAG: hypothetical protein HY911_04535 [Desulfobacterales bacterium]|nr:hypothetical protein [Desulfobacterales bacterium]
MADSVMLQLADRQIERFVSYRINSDLFEAADAFELNLSGAGVTVTEGEPCRLFVNGRLELVGIVDKVSEQFAKDEAAMTIEGRDLMGLLVDSYAEDFEDREGESLTALAQRLLATVPFINRKAIIYGRGSKDRAVPLTAREDEYEFTEVQPKRTVFEVLRSYALARGMLFFAMPDGTLVFGEPRTSGAAEFRLVRRRFPSGRQNNVLNGERVRDISRRYSKVTAIAQRQGTDSAEVDDINASGTVTDAGFPFYKPFVATVEHDGQDPQRYARVLMDKQRFEGFTLSYRTVGHSQQGRNFQTNAVCRVLDEPWGIDTDYLIYGRTFERSRQGVFTTVKLSKLGVLPA